jgi:hypothetical protein
VYLFYVHIPPLAIYIFLIPPFTQYFPSYPKEKREPPPPSSALAQNSQRLPLRAFKKIGRVGTLPALAHSGNPAGIQQAIAAPMDDLPAPGSAMSSSSRATTTANAFQRWAGHRRGSHLGWDSARPQSAARQQQQMLEKIYTKGELKVKNRGNNRECLHLYVVY